VDPATQDGRETTIISIEGELLRRREALRRRSHSRHRWPSTTGTTGRPKLLAEIYGVYKRREADRGLIPGTGQGAIRSWGRISPDDRILFTLAGSVEHAPGQDPTGLIERSHGRRQRKKTTRGLDLWTVRFRQLRTAQSASAQFRERPGNYLEQAVILSQDLGYWFAKPRRLVLRQLGRRGSGGRLPRPHLPGRECIPPWRTIPLISLSTRSGRRDREPCRFRTPCPGGRSRALPSAWPQPRQVYAGIASASVRGPLPSPVSSMNRSWNWRRLSRWPIETIAVSGSRSRSSR
jgi:hypothetical protein